MKKDNHLIHTETPVTRRILIIREKKVIIDADLAVLYNVPTKRLNEQVKRNKNRFPHDFMFQLTEKEKQEVVANCDRLKNLKYSPVLPYAFTEHGILMAANVLNSEKAIEMSIFIVRIFIKLREMISTHQKLSKKLAELECRIDSHDEDIKSIVAAIRRFIEPKKSKTRRIGF